MDEGVVGHRGNIVISAEEIKALHAVSTTHIIIASWFHLQSPCRGNGIGMVWFSWCSLCAWSTWCGSLWGWENV